MKTSIFSLIIAAFVLLSAGTASLSGQSTALMPDTGRAIQVSTPNWQANVPAQLVSITMSPERLIQGAAVLNTDSSKLVQLQFGCVLIGSMRGESKPRALKVFIGEPISVSINSRDVGGTGALPWSMSDAIQFAKSAQVTDVNALVGIVSANFESGASYTYDLEREKKFIEQPSPMIDEIYSLIDQEKVVRASQGQISRKKSTSRNHGTLATIAGYYK